MPMSYMGWYQFMQDVADAVIQRDKIWFGQLELSYRIMKPAAKQAHRKEVIDNLGYLIGEGKISFDQTNDSELRERARNEVQRAMGKIRLPDLLTHE